MGAAMHLRDRVGRHIKLQDLHVFMTVAQAGSMGKAAKRLNKSQPNISRSIAELEYALGVSLFDRHRQGIEPTEYGRALLDCGMAVFDDLRQGIKNIEFLSDPTAGEVRIGCNPFLAASFISFVVDRLSQRNPRIVFHLVTAPAETLYRELSERNVDLLIVRKFGALADKRMNSRFGSACWRPGILSRFFPLPPCNFRPGARRSKSCPLNFQSATYQTESSP